MKEESIYVLNSTNKFIDKNIYSKDFKNNYNIKYLISRRK